MKRLFATLLTATTAFAADTFSPLILNSDLTLPTWATNFFTANAGYIPASGAAGKLDATNGTAVNLTGSLTNVSVFGNLVIDSGDELQDTVDYSLALTPNGNTPTENDASPRPRSVATIASLVADVDPALVPDYARISVLGYSSAGDGGGGNFRRALASSGTTNLGTFFKSTANPTYAWQRVESNPVLPEMFGAKGDGFTDDTVAVNAAGEYAAANNITLVAALRYKLTSSFLLRDNITIDGRGTGKFLRGFAGNGTYTNTFGTLQNYPLALIGSYTNASEVPANTTNITLRNIAIENLNANVWTNGRSLCLWGVRGVTLENVFIGPIANGWSADIWADDGVMSGCVITNVAEVFSDAFHLIGGRRWTITGNQFYGGDDALALLQVYDHSMSDVTVANNYLRSYKAHAIRIGRWDNVPAAYHTNAMERINVTDNVCEAGWRNGGIFVQDQVVSGTNYTKLLRDITISDTKILLRSDFPTGGVTNGYGVRVLGGKDITLAGLTVTNAYGNSVLNHVDGLSLSKVSIRNNYLFNVSFEGNTTLSLVDCDFASDRASSTVALYGNGATVLRGGTYNNSGAVNALLIQGTGSDNVTLSQVRFTGNGVGVNLNPLPATFSAFQCDFASTLTPISYSGAGAGGTKPAVIDLFGNVNLADYFRNASVTYVVPITKSVGSSATMETYTRTDTSTSATVDMQGGFLSWHTSQNWFQYESALGLYGRSSTANSTRKTFIVGVQHYTTSEEPVGLIRGDSDASTSDLYLGGGSSTVNSVTKGHFMAGADTATTTGLEVGHWTTNGFYLKTVLVTNTLTASDTIELGHASDTTLARSAAGVITVEGNKVPSPASPSTGQILVFTNSNWAAMTPGASGVGGSTGSTDNSLLRADGTGGATLQNSAVLVDDFTSSTANNVAIKVDDGSTANIAAVITPKGTGAFILGAKPDGTATGGNARGARAIDLQIERLSATDVASGKGSTILGGYRNSATSDFTVAGGAISVASGQFGAVALGYGVTASGQYGAFGTGYATTASGRSSMAAGDSAVANKRGQFAISGGSFGSSGDSQTTILTARNNTSSTTPTVLFLDGSSAYITIPNNTTWTFTALLTGATASGAATYSYKFEGVIVNAAGTTSMPVAVTKTVIYESNAAADADATANNTQDSLDFTVTAANSTATRWSVSVTANQLSY